MGRGTLPISLYYNERRTDYLSTGVASSNPWNIAFASAAAALISPPSCAVMMTTPIASRASPTDKTGGFQPEFPLCIA